jgi:hypothetical protein
MNADMDIDMDLDIGLAEDDLAIPEIEVIPDTELSVSSDPESQHAIKADILIVRCA